MIPGAIRDSNLMLLGNSPDVQDIPALRMHDGCIATAWIPSPKELAALNAGASVILFVHSDRHPPVQLGVSEP